MRLLVKVFALIIVWTSGALMLPQAASAQQVRVSYQLFYDELSPYGMWVDYPNYGYVWIPDAEPGFSPYLTSGHWEFTDDGWTWVSDYPWGWATFHYGRWDYDNSYGWFWVPDDEWGPAWVSWRRSPGYYGWAPLRPGISMSIAFGRDYHERNESWTFVREGDIRRSDIGSHYVNRTNNTTIINGSTVIVNTRRDDRRNATYIAGPDRDDVQRVTHATVNSVAIRDAGQPGAHVNNGELQIYRPQVQKRSGNGPNPAPAKVTRLNDVRPSTERNAGTRQQQPPTVNPPSQAQPSQPPAITPPANRGRQQQSPAVSPPNRNQSSQPKLVSPPASRGRQQQQRVAGSPNQSQPSQPRAVGPSDSKGRQQQSRTVAPPNKSQPAQQKAVNPSSGKGKQPQNVAPPKKNEEPQPRNKQEEKPKPREQ